MVGLIGVAWSVARVCVRVLEVGSVFQRGVEWGDLSESWNGSTWYLGDLLGVYTCAIFWVPGLVLP